MERVGEKPDGSMFSGELEGEMEKGRVNSTLKTGKKLCGGWKERRIVKAFPFKKFLFSKVREIITL